ncbi:MAG: winged helix DNA-binding protein [Chloroflexi bacterium]|nr:winged helix DNA-binding protein [Chloroflexota bacterium]
MRHFHSFKSEEDQARFEKMHRHFEKFMVDLSGTDDLRGFQLANLIRRTANIYDAIYHQHNGDSDISGPRLAILIRLYIEDSRGTGEGITPTIMSRFQNVGKNTISSLLNGLEEQGLLQRENDPSDRRIYRLKITDKGRTLVKELAPRQMEFMNMLTADLTDEESDHLIALLGKLVHSLQTHVRPVR